MKTIKMVVILVTVTNIFPTVIVVCSLGTIFVLRKSKAAVKHVKLFG